MKCYGMGMLRYASKADIVSADVVAVVSVVSLAYQIGGKKEGELLKMSTLCIPPMSTTYFRPGRCAELISVLPVFCRAWKLLAAAVVVVAARLSAVVEKELGGV